MKTTGSSKTFVMSVKLHGVMCQKTSNLHGDCRKNPNVTSLQLTLSSLFVRSLHLDRVDFLFSYCDIYIYIYKHIFIHVEQMPLVLNTVLNLSRMSGFVADSH